LFRTKLKSKFIKPNNKRSKPPVDWLQCC